jgi:hypothetical protein
MYECHLEVHKCCIKTTMHVRQKIVIFLDYTVISTVSGVYPIFKYFINVILI